MIIYIWKNKSHVPNHQPVNWFPENDGQFTPNMCLEINEFMPRPEVPIPEEGMGPISYRRVESFLENNQ